MKIEISKQVSVIETIDVELPYYYECDLDADRGLNIIYGKIEEFKETTIQKEEYGDGKFSFKVEVDPHSSLKNSGLATWFKPEYKSEKSDFEDAKNEAMAFINKF